MTEICCPRCSSYDVEVIDGEGYVCNDCGTYFVDVEEPDLDNKEKT